MSALEIFDCQFFQLTQQDFFLFSLALRLVKKSRLKIFFLLTQEEIKILFKSYFFQLAQQDFFFPFKFLFPVRNRKFWVLVEKVIILENSQASTI